MPSLSESLRQRGIDNHSFDRIGERRDVARLNEKPCFIGHNHLRNSTDRRRNNRQAGGHRFHNHGRQVVSRPIWIDNTGQTQDPGGRKPLYNFLLRFWTGQTDV